MSLRLKMKLQTVTQNLPSEAGGRNETLQFYAVMGDDNKPWSKWTPGGSLNFTITNPAAEALELGRDYFVTIEAA